MYSKNYRIYSTGSNYDCIFIPSGGLEKDGTPHEWVKRRLDKVIEIQTGKEYIIPLGFMTAYKAPPLNRKKFPIKESVVSADYLVSRGISKRKVMVEIFSGDTIGNGYFSRLFFSDPFNFKNILVITSAHHMPRVRAIFKWVYGLSPRKNKYQLDFLSVSDEGIDPIIIGARLKKEKQSLKNVLSMKKKIRTLSGFHHWLFTRHALYAYGLEVGKVPPKTLKTY